MPIEPSDFKEKSALYLPKEAQYPYLVNLPDDIKKANIVAADGRQMNSLGEVVNYAMVLVEKQSEQLTGVLPKDYTNFSDDILAELLRIFNNNALVPRILINWHIRLSDCPYAASSSIGNARIASFGFIAYEQSSCVNVPEIYYSVY